MCVPTRVASCSTARSDADGNAAPVGPRRPEYLRETATTSRSARRSRRRCRLRAPATVAPPARCTHAGYSDAFLEQPGIGCHLEFTTAAITARRMRTRSRWWCCTSAPPRRCGLQPTDRTHHASPRQIPTGLPSGRHHPGSRRPPCRAHSRSVAVTFRTRPVDADPGPRRTLLAQTSGACSARRAFCCSSSRPSSAEFRTRVLRALLAAGSESAGPRAFRLLSSVVNVWIRPKVMTCQFAGWDW